MTIKPMLFSGPMVRALLDGCKTMTRRVLKPQPRPGLRGDGSPVADGYFVWEPKPGHVIPLTDGCAYQWREQLPYATGDVLWVRENFYQYGGPIEYAADDDAPSFQRKVTPSIHMPRWASRLTLEVTDVRVEKLGYISREDAVAEGCPGVLNTRPDYVYSRWDSDPIDEFVELWDSINAKRGYGWDDNPWVVAITFTVHRCNVDSFGPCPDMQRSA